MAGEKKRRRRKKRLSGLIKKEKENMNYGS